MLWAQPQLPQGCHLANVGEMDVAVPEMAEAGDARTGVDRLACPRQALRARRNSSRFACASAVRVETAPKQRHEQTMGRPRVWSELTTPSKF